MKLSILLQQLYVLYIVTVYLHDSLHVPFEPFLRYIFAAKMCSRQSYCFAQGSYGFAHNRFRAAQMVESEVTLSNYYELGRFENVGNCI